MLTRLFNWIKFKTLPPSVNFKNRLFIERDNKHRRITSGLGFTFRNSKWSDYRRSNVTFLALNSFKDILKAATLFTLCFFLFIGMNKYFNFFNLPTKVYTILWFIGDTTLYAKLTSLSVSAFYLQLFVHNSFHKLLTSIGAVSDNAFPNVSSSEKFSKTSKPLNKEVFYKWSLFNDVDNFNLLNSLFTSSKSGINNQLTDFYKLLYRLDINDRNSIKTVWDFQTSPISTPKVLNTTDLLLNNLLMTPNSKVLKTNSSWALSTFTDWDLNKVTLEINEVNNIATLKGLFNSPLSNFTELSDASTHMENNIDFTLLLENQINWVRTSRWLYRYNVLHRRTVAASHKNTLTKRLIGSGFYDSSLDSLNINVCSLKSLNDNWSSMFSFMNMRSYPDFYNSWEQPISQLYLNNRWNHLQSNVGLTFSENSFFWFVKRFYLFNTFPSLRREITFDLPLLNNYSYSTNINSVLDLKLLLKTLNLNPSRKSALTSQIAPLKHSNTNPFNQFSTVYELTSSDLFSYDFTEKAIMLLAKPMGSASNTPYYSCITQTTPVYTNMTFKKLL